MKKVIAAIAIIFATTLSARADGILKSQISEVLAENKATISIGSTGGVQPGMAFNILNDQSEQIGTLTILEAGTDKSTGVYFMFKSSDSAPKPGSVVTFTSGAPAASGTDLTIPTNTIVELLLDNDISSQDNKTGDTITFTVKSPISIAGVEVIGPGAKAYGEITEAKPAKGYGKSGRLEFSVKYVTATDGTNVPLSFELQKKQDGQYVKAALGAYATGFLGGGAMKGKKVTIAKGTVFNVYVPTDVKLGSVQIVVTPQVMTGTSNVTSAVGATSQQPAVKLVTRDKRPPEQVRIAFIGFNDTFNDKGDDVLAFTGKKISTFVAYKLQWDTHFKFVNQKEVVAKTGGDLQPFYFATGTTLQPSQRYNIAEISKLGRDLGVDYIVAGDILKYMVEEHKKVNKGRRAMNILTLASGSGGAMMEDVKKEFTFAAAIDVAVIDTQAERIVWNQVCSGEHKGSKWLEKDIDDKNPLIFKAGGAKYMLVNTIDVKLRKSDDPISFSGTEEAVGVLRAMNLFISSFNNLH